MLKDQESIVDKESNGTWIKCEPCALNFGSESKIGVKTRTTIKPPTTTSV